MPKDELSRSPADGRATRFRMRSSAIASACLTLVLLMGCGGPTSSTAPPIGGESDTVFGCHGGDLILCQAMVEAAVESLAPEDGRPTWAEVRAAACDGQCLPGLAGIRQGQVTIEVAGGRAVAVEVELRDGQLTVAERVDAQLFAREPGSGPAQGPQVEMELGHCGLMSGIDVDGSFWNPIGLIQEHPDAINAARASFSMINSALASLRTEGGFVVQLVRHVGPKHFPACD